MERYATIILFIKQVSKFGGQHINISNLFIFSFCSLGSGTNYVFHPHTSDIRSFLGEGLAKTTRASYARGADVWLTFLGMKGLSQPRAHYPLQTWSMLSVSQQLYVIITFIMWLKSSKGWNAGRISSSISGVRDYVRSHLLSLEAFNHESVTLAIKATQPTGRAMSIMKEARKRLPVTSEMLDWFKLQCWKQGTVVSREDIDKRMTFLGVAIGLTFLRRVSEYAVDGRSQHTILSDDVHFITRHNPPVVLASFDVATCALSVKDIETVRFIFRTSKKDQGGRGSYHFLASHNPRELALIKCLLHWCMIAHLIQGAPFFSREYNGRRKNLRPCMVNRSLKQIADHFGLGCVRDAFTSHSLRIGGATALIASGSTREAVQRIGGWSTAPTSSDSIYELNKIGRAHV